MGQRLCLNSILFFVEKTLPNARLEPNERIAFCVSLVVAGLNRNPGRASGSAGESASGQLAMSARAWDLEVVADVF
jgi:hypothetical protein